MKTPSTMSPLEAYEALMLFARRRGEGALRLAMHAAVPQSFRPDLLHLLKLNFLPRELHDPAAEADVLFSPLCEETGRGYFEFGPHARTLLLDNLAANYAGDRTPRIERVANFLLHYVEQSERRAAGTLDRLWRDYLEVQRWVALAFLDADAAARQLAAALKGTDAPAGEFAARLRLGGLASALSSPLVKYRHVLDYAAGLQALEAGDHERARTLLSALGDEELEVGGVRLRPASDLLRAYAAQSPAPAPPPDKTFVPEEVEDAPPRARIFLSYAREDRERVEEAYKRLREFGHEPWADFASVQPGEPWEETVRAARENADAVIFFLSQNSARKSGHLQRQIQDALRQTQERSEANFFIIPVLLEPCEIPPELSHYSGVDLSAEGGWAALETVINLELEQRKRKDPEGGVHEEKIRALGALAGSDEPGALETLTEAVWREEDARVRLAAVLALSKCRSESAYEALLFAAGDEDAVVRSSAAEGLLTAPINPVLIFGFFGTDHVENREVLREELRRRGYVPLVFPYTRPPLRNVADIMRAVTHLVSFAIADLTAPPEIQEDLGSLLELFLSETGRPLVPVHQGVTLSKLPTELRKKYPSVFPLHTYSGAGELREALERIISEPFETKQHEPQTTEQAPPRPRPFRFPGTIFISYAEEDDATHGQTQRWVDGFQKILEIELMNRFGSREAAPRVWRDTRVFNKERFFDDLLMKELSEATLFIAILTPSYALSKHCWRELAFFTDNVVGSDDVLVGDRSRVLKIIKEPGNENFLPEELARTPGYSFFEYKDSPRAQQGRRPGESAVAFDQRSQQFARVMRQVVHDIYEIIRELRRSTEAS